MVPFCFGIVPSGHRSIDVPQFPAFFSEATGGAGALSGYWQAGTHLAAPLSEVLCTGLSFEAIPELIIQQDMSIEALKAELKSRDQPVSGSKSLLIQRLETAVQTTNAVPVFRGRQLTKDSSRRLREISSPYCVLDWLVMHRPSKLLS